MNKKKRSVRKVKEPVVQYVPRQLKVYSSFEEQENDELRQMSELSYLEILLQLRKMINTAYGMHGYNPSKLPSRHTLRILEYPQA